MEFFINPLSASCQCNTADEVDSVVNKLLECFEYLLPAIESQRVRLVYDSRLEQNCLMGGVDFRSSISRLSKDNDATRLWYLYTYNRAEEASSSNSVDVEVGSANESIDSVSGVISEDLCFDNASWISFSGSSLNEELDFIVNSENDICSVKNSHHLDSLRGRLPIYEASPKHRSEPYFDAQRGEMVSAMPLNDDEAQKLLLTSLPDGNDRWAYHSSRKRFYRFKLTHVDRSIYHGFEVDDQEVPGNISAQLV